MKPQVVITQRVHREVLERLSRHCELIANQSRKTLPPQEVLRRTQSADALMAFMTDRVDRDFVRACTQLHVIGCALKGYDNFDVQACSENGIWISNVPDLLTVPTVELVIGLMIGLGRHVRHADDHIRSGRFQGWRPVYYGTGLAGRQVGILGMGEVGRALAERLAAFGCHIVYCDPEPLPADSPLQGEVSRVDFDALLRESDYLILATPLTERTVGLFNDETLAALKPGALLINPSRGSLVDEAAVTRALTDGRLGGYAADVFEMEDWLRDDRPRRIAPLLLEHPRTLFTAHIGSAVQEVRLAVENRAADNILQALRGERPADAVNEPSIALAG